MRNTSKWVSSITNTQVSSCRRLLPESRSLVQTSRWYPYTRSVREENMVTIEKRIHVIPLFEGRASLASWVMQHDLTMTWYWQPSMMETDLCGCCHRDEKNIVIILRNCGLCFLIAWRFGGEMPVLVQHIIRLWMSQRVMGTRLA